MPTPSRRSGSRALRPLPEPLEDRQLLSTAATLSNQSPAGAADPQATTTRSVGPLATAAARRALAGTSSTASSATGTGTTTTSHAGKTRNPLPNTVVTGMDQFGDVWELELFGPGALRVVKQPDANGNPTPLDAMTPIQTIEVAGTAPLATRLIGKVLKKGPTGDGRIFFQNLLEYSGKGQVSTLNNGLLSVDMPDFWLANTSANPGLSGGQVMAQINIPDGVNTLRIGGADTTVFLGTNSSLSLQNLGQNSVFLVNLGQPQYHGTSVIVDKVITSGQAPPANAAAGTPPTQQGVVFNVTGRLNLFQANEIDGNANQPTSPFFTASTVSSGEASIPITGGAGTIVVSGPSPLTSTTGQIGSVQVGGNATNFSVQTNDRINSMYIGGETNNVSLLAPSGARTLQFGRGMDSVDISTHTIQYLFANRGAVNSRVVTDRQIGRANIGGDVVNTQILSGYAQGLATVFSTQAAGPVPVAQPGGGMTATIAGSVINSYFAASVVPSSNGTFGGTDNLVEPQGHINAKIEGLIDNSNASTTAPNVAFLAQRVHLAQGPVIPPNVPEQPFTNKTPVPSVGLVGYHTNPYPQNALVRYHSGLNVLHSAQGSGRTPAAIQGSLDIPSLTTPPGATASATTRTARSTPRGPRSLFSRSTTAGTTPTSGQSSSGA